MKRRISLISIIGFLVVACSITSNELETKLYKGYYKFGFETSSFERCNSKERWWVVPANDDSTFTKLTESYFRINDKNEWYKPVYVHFYGNPSKLGKYGHTNAYERRFELIEVQVIRAIQSEDCK